MNKKNVTLAFATALLFANGILASEPTHDIGELDINTIVYIEEEEVIELGFDTADYLPEGFNPYEVYFNIESVEFVEQESKIKIRRHKKRLPKNFDPYAYPTDASSFNYIDEDDTIELDFDSTKHLPEGFDPYIKS